MSHSIIASLSAILVFAASPVWAQQVRVRDPVMVTPLPSQSGELGNSLCVDPTDPKRLIVAVSVDPHPSEPLVDYLGTGMTFSRAHVEVLYSEDGGASWLPRFRTYGAELEGDPACAFGADGTAYVGAMPGDSHGRFRDFNVWRSRDGGKSWDSKPTRIEYPRFFDRAFMVIDHQRSAPHGRLYVVGYGMTRLSDDTLEAPDQMVAFASDDGGRSFHSPVTILTGCGETRARICVTHPGASALLSDGALLTSWFNIYNSYTGVKSPDGSVLSDGARLEFEQPGLSRVGVARLSSEGHEFEMSTWVGLSGRWRNEKGEIIGGKYVPALAVDATKGPYRDRAYLAWSDGSSGRGEILLSHSTDRGATWSSPEIISSDRPLDPLEPLNGPNSFNVTAAVNKNGVVGVFYYTNRSRSERSAEGMLVTSADGGRTWSAPVRLIRPDSKALRVTPSEARRVAASPYVGSEDGYFYPSCAHGFTTDANGLFHALVYEYSTGHPRLFSVAATVEDEGR